MTPAETREAMGVAREMITLWLINGDTAGAEHVDYRIRSLLNRGNHDAVVALVTVLIDAVTGMFDSIEDWRTHIIAADAEAAEGG